MAIEIRSESQESSSLIQVSEENARLSRTHQLRGATTAFDHVAAAGFIIEATGLAII